MIGPVEEGVENRQEKPIHIGRSQKASEEVSV